MASLTNFARPQLSWPHLVSDILSPPFVWLMLVGLVALEYTQTPLEALYWASIFGLLVCVLPVAYIIAMVGMGKISDLHMRNRKDRYRPLVVAIIGAVLASLLLRNMGAPRVFTLLALFGLVQISVIALVTLRWQISMHAMGITAAVVASGIIFNPHWALLGVPLIILVSAARLHLKCHNAAQILAGSMVGAFVPVILLTMVPHVLTAFVL